MVRRIVLLFSLVALAVGASASIASADSLPSGERSFHNASLEPAYNAEKAGQLGYLLTPNKAPMKASPAAWSPLYIVVYPVSNTDVPTLNCMHEPVENCPSHGNEVAGLAMQGGLTKDAAIAQVYAGGVLGHDHVGDFPGGADFNFAWEPVAVLFTDEYAANHDHLVTDAQIAAAKAAGDVVEEPLPPLTFNCAWVPETLWSMATPVVPVG